METANLNPKKIEINGWHFLVRRPQEKAHPKRILLLLHGHLGNEKVMWTLTKPIPDKIIMIAPRAPVKMGEDQYSWHKISPNWHSIDAYQKLAEVLMNRVNLWKENEGLEISHYDVMGFSQGAVMAYALAIIYPELIRKVAALAGFIPHSWMQQLQDISFNHKSFYIAHGTQDEIVPIEKARQTVSWLKEKNAWVTFCETETGHKLSVNCFNELGIFFANDH